jgi:hypothetical protein
MLSVDMTEILILFLLYTDTFLMHQPHCSILLVVITISVGAQVEFDHEASRNVIGMRTASLRPCSDLTLRCRTQVIFNLIHIVTALFHTHSIMYVHSLCQYL